jgi:hypothetical protein
MIVQHSASERGYRNLNATVKNIVDDYGATPGGSSAATGDYTAFKSFHDFAIEQTDWVELIIPPSPDGSYYGVNGSYTHGSNLPFFGIPKLIVSGYGAAMNGLHGGALANNNTARALIDSVDAGETTVTIKSADAAKISHYEADGMVLVAGLDLQGFGYPPNPHFFEWRRIASVDGTSITFTEPLTYSYKDYWPNFWLGNGFELGGLGAASIVPTMAGWDCEHRIYGLRSYKPGQQTYYFVRKALLIDVKSDDDGWIIGAGEDHRIINQDHTTSQMEVDKLTTHALIGEYDPSNRNILVQSSSVDFMEVRGGSRGINGCAKRMLVHGGSSPFVVLGPTAYGVSEQITFRDHVITGTVSGSPGLAVSLGDDLTYEGDGIFRYSGEAVPQWFIPGAVGVLRAATVGFHHVFRIIDISSDGGNIGDDILIETDIEGEELPVLDGYANNAILRHSAPDVTFENCTGGEQPIELSLVPPNSPFGIFTRRQYTGAVYGNGFVSLGLTFGRLVHMKVNVEQAYTGVAATLRLQLSQFHYYAVNADRTVTNVQQAGFYFNLKAAGERVITPGGVTGAQAGDLGLDMLTGGVWLPGQITMYAGLGNGTGVNISGEDASLRPIVTIEILTDQEIPAAA